MAAAATSVGDFSEAETETRTRPEIALTTLFTPPSSCDDQVTYDGTTLWQHGVSQMGDTSCFPPRFLSIYNSYYSPGICPDRWTSAGSVAHLSGFDAMCCPTSYFLSTTEASVLANFCFSLMTTAMSNVVIVTDLGDIPAEDPSYVTLETSDVSSTTVYADVIQVQWQSSDRNIISLLQQSTARSSSRAPTSRGASPASPVRPTVPAATSASMSSSPAAGTGLSTGAKVGIGIGVPIAVLALSAIAAFFFLLRRRKRRTPIPVTQDYKGPGFHEMDPVGVAHVPPVEMDASAVNELEGSNVRSELENKERGSRSFRSNPGGYLSSLGSPQSTPSTTPMGSKKYARSSKASAPSSA